MVVFLFRVIVGILVFVVLARKYFIERPVVLIVYSKSLFKLLYVGCNLLSVVRWQFLLQLYKRLKYSV